MASANSNDHMKVEDPISPPLDLASKASKKPSMTSIIGETGQLVRPYKAQPGMKSFLSEALDRLYDGEPNAFRVSRNDTTPNTVLVDRNTLLILDQQFISNSTTEEIEKPLLLYVSKPPEGVEPSGVLVVHLHGGAMLYHNASDHNYRSIRDRIAQSGAICIGPEFRNGVYPIGLYDCITTVRWVNANKEFYHIDTVVLCGESGGANLAIATYLELKSELQIDGAYISSPYIAGTSHYVSQTFPSLKLNDGNLLTAQSLEDGSAEYYDDRVLESNASAWPIYASHDQLAGAPPFSIVVNEFDSLRDEGEIFYEKLQEANPNHLDDFFMKEIKGTFHTSDFLIDLDPEEATRTFDRISQFCAHCRRRKADRIPS